VGNEQSETIEQIRQDVRNMQDEKAPKALKAEAPDALSRIPALVGRGDSAGELRQLDHSPFSASLKKHRTEAFASVRCFLL